MVDPLHAKVAPELYNEMKGRWSDPVRVLMTEGQDGEVEVLFQTLPRLWLVTGPWAMHIVRAFTAEEAIGRTFTAERDVDGDARCSASERGVAMSDLDATEITPQGPAGVVAEHTG